MEKKKSYKPNTCVSAYEFMEKFPDEHTARLYLEKLRWNGTPVCPYCGKTHATLYRADKGLYWCPDCRLRFTVTVNTIFHSTKIKLHKWLFAIYLIMTERKGLSSYALSKIIGVRQATAWYMQQRIREAFTNGDDTFLTGIVEGDESYLGGANENRHESKKLTHAQANEQKIKIVAVRERGTGRIKADVVGNVTKTTISNFIGETVEPGSVVCTDESSVYNDIERDYIRKTVNHSAKEYVDGMATTNGIESFWALLKRGFYGTFHWFSAKHAHRYVHEFAFRVYEGSCDRHSYDRMDSALRYIFMRHTTYREITAA